MQVCIFFSLCYYRCFSTRSETGHTEWLYGVQISSPYIKFFFKLIHHIQSNNSAMMHSLRCNMNLNQKKFIIWMFLRKNIFITTTVITSGCIHLYIYQVWHWNIHTQIELTLISLYKCCVEWKSACLAKKR